MFVFGQNVFLYSNICFISKLFSFSSELADIFDQVDKRNASEK